MCRNFPREEPRLSEKMGLSRCPNSRPRIPLAMRLWILCWLPVITTRNRTVNRPSPWRKDTRLRTRRVRPSWSSRPHKTAFITSGIFPSLNPQSILTWCTVARALSKASNCPRTQQSPDRKCSNKAKNKKCLWVNARKDRQTKTTTATSCQFTRKSQRITWTCWA